MKPTNVAAMAGAKIPSGRHMARRPKKIKPGTETVHISFLLDADIAARIDAEAERRTKEDPARRRWTRTDTLKALLVQALGAAGTDKTK